MKRDLTISPPGLFEQAYQRSQELLQRNLSDEGILACTPGEKARGRHYTSIFGRDAAICALGMIGSGDALLEEGARCSLTTLARHQAPNGQIPKFVQPESGEVDFWYTGCIDATLWWLIALAVHDKASGDASLRVALAPATARALQWLSCQEHPTWGLLQQNEASDWADIMPRSGFVLYTNALWYLVKRLYDLPGIEVTRAYAQTLFDPFGPVVPEHRRARLLAHYIRNKARGDGLFLSFVNFSHWGAEGDLFANVLAALTGLADSSRAVRVCERVQSLGAQDPWPLRVVAHPIARDSALWRPYMGRHQQNLPYQYHNGGCWPFAGGFWVMLLARLGRMGEARQQLARLAAANAVGHWQFNEWFHGRSGRPMGMAGQSWNAAMYLTAHRAVFEGARPF
ncbi:amylo-alpha-1,6-glucosidase [Geoalkalibacter halelectricus]|uniref:beta-fructofuranosidase n=1 Tax=Geoalkalibacter halelectricus TaxID=2847045 RepID=A0ABY5ZPW6_9BACT|nr:glycoside hydrolase 100 family protein [Geoalkalibacter halelectricus]MDO3378704.1 glycoside hydrolase [Geoalkalibacter halelectricus]UWZ79987.1 glycoside hydrolase [Geoalkalibacter halelectricus]